MKKLFRSVKKLLISVIFCLICNVSIAENKIIATVEGDIITTNNLEKRYLAFIKTNNLSPSLDEIKTLKMQVLHSLINERVIAHEARRLKIDITDEEIKSAIANIERSQNLPEGSFIQHHEEYGITKDDLWEQMRVKLAWQKILIDFIFPIHGQAVISDKELNEFVIQNYPGFIKVNGFIYKFNSNASKPIERLYEADTEDLCSVQSLKNLTSYTPAKISLPLERIENAKIRQVASFTQDLPRIITAKEGKKTVVLVLCKKKPTISEEELNKIRERLKNKKMELHTQYYLKNLKRQMAIKINEML
ncbi:MAG: SurA N-terminal domain-containing protein [Rickettsiales bacterium]|nr:SurA N-terminal domain-containing protein [Rickettsiales bacterium]